MFKLIISEFQNLRLRFKAANTFIPVGDRQIKPFLIVSAGRSGTTLLRRMLMVNDNLHIPPESDDLIPSGAKYFILNSKKEWNDLVKDILAEFENSSCFKFWETELSAVKNRLIQLPKIDRSYAGIIDAIYRHHAATLGKNNCLWGDKTPYLMYQLDWLRLILPNARYIHLVRDGRAVTHSMMMKQNYTIQAASTRWKDSIRLFNKHLAYIDSNKYLQIRYEDLIEDPEQTLRAVCLFLGVTFKKEMVYEIPRKMGDIVLAHHDNVSRLLNKDFLNSWRNDLSDDQILFLNRKLSNELKALKYF